MPTAKHEKRRLRMGIPDRRSDLRADELTSRHDN
jgi:hypothetical protein